MAKMMNGYKKNLQKYSAAFSAFIAIAAINILDLYFRVMRAPEKMIFKHHKRKVAPLKYEAILFTI